MGSVDSPITWVPYMNNNDCSQGFCSVYCPQWCYIIVPPPPPPIDFPDHNSSPNFSPLVIAIIGILACAILVVIYYTVISKYCGNTNNDHSIRDENHYTSEQLENNQSPSIHEPWHVETTNGLDEALIKSITVCKYKKGDGFIEGTDCSVCLSEFEENEKIRLLPKCSHAFHLPCIDTWLKSHSNCPLCRANIVLPPPQTQVSVTNESMVASQSERVNENAMTMEQEQQRVDEDRVIEQSDQVVPKSPLRGYSELGNSEEKDTIIEIRGEGYEGIIIRSSSHPQQNCVLVADILGMNEDEDEDEDEDVRSFYPRPAGRGTVSV